MPPLTGIFVRRVTIVRAFSTSLFFGVAVVQLSDSFRVAMCVRPGFEMRAFVPRSNWPRRSDCGSCRVDEVAWLLNNYVNRINLDLLAIIDHRAKSHRPRFSNRTQKPRSIQRRSSTQQKVCLMQL